jgi:hypothetical protein
MKTLVAIGVACVLVASCTPSTPTAAVSPGTRPGPSSAADTPTLTQQSALSWDGVDGRVMLISPTNPQTGGTAELRAWTFSGGSWQSAKAPAVTAISFFRSLFLAYDSTRNREIFVVDINGINAVQTWEWDGRSWQQISTPHPPRGFTHGAYSPDLHALVGWDGTAFWYDTWVYDGTDWRAIRTTETPFISNSPSVDYDPIRHSIVALSTNDYATWLWSGTDWSLQPAASRSPAAGGGWGRGIANIALDRQNGRWLVQGGGSGYSTSLLSDTSSGDSSGWREEVVSTSPGPRGDSKLTWDPQHREVLLFGGRRSPSSATYFVDAWAWDGSTWSQLAGPVAAPSTACQLGSGYGLLIAASHLQMVDTCGGIPATTPIAPSSVHECTAGFQAVLAPPVSSTNDLVYYRDGDTKVRSLSPDGRAADVTTVPGGASTVSFFSVSPDDQRIAVVVEDVSPANSVGLRLYVEDLHGGGHHADLYTTSVLKSSGTTLWPMGWHQGSLVLAVMIACSANVASLSPVSWHVVDATTADRQASIDASSCGTLSVWPSPAGVVCAQYNGTGIYDWSGKELIGINEQACQAAQTSLSPSGTRYFYAATAWACYPPGPSAPYTALEERPYSQIGAVPWHAACLWIDEDHLLAPDSVIALTPSASPTLTRLPASGTCAGRFPGGL